MAKKRVGAGSKTRPTAMVKPPPSKSLVTKPKLPEIRTHPDVLTLEEILHLAGNDRAYTVLDHHGGVWMVLFEGDTVPSIVDIEDGKPVIEQVK